MVARKITKKSKKRALVKVPKTGPVEFNLAPRTVKVIRALKENFSPYGMIVFLRTYARKKENGELETWHDVVLRVIGDTFYFKKKQAKKWNEEREQRLALDMAKAMFHFYWLPPGRGLWAMQRKYIEKYGSMALNNCGFVSTTMEEFGNLSLAVAIEWMMDASMLGVGVGFDCDWNGTVHLPTPVVNEIVIEDTREGWFESVNALMRSYLIPGQNRCVFDYSLIRPEGAPILGFGGVAAGPQVLELAHARLSACFECFYRCQEGMPAKESIRIMLEQAPKYEDATYMHNYAEMLARFDAAHADLKSYENVRLIVDVFNIVGVCVVSGNVRRSAEVALGDPRSREFLNMKNWSINPERENSYGWMSNNSVRIENKEQYEDVINNIAPLIIANGEPGIVNLIKINAVDPKNPKHKRDRGVNPCVEITLESFELCCLSEVFPSNCVDEDGVFSMEIYLNACKYAAIYASVVSCIPVHNKHTAEIVNRNHRIGVSQSGLWQMYEMLNREDYLTMLDKAFHVVKMTANKYVFEFCGTLPIAVTTIKPSGTISSLAQSLPGVHPGIESRYAMRRIRIGKNLPLAQALITAGIRHEASKTDGSAWIFCFPIDQGKWRAANEVPMWEQCMMALEVQDRYSDNGVSVSLYFERNTEAAQLPQLIKYILPHVKGISFMPREYVRALTLEGGHKLVFNPECSDAVEKLIASVSQYTNAAERERFDKSKGVIYIQPPFTTITEDEYIVATVGMPAFDPAVLNRRKDLEGADGSATKYCDAMKCSI